MLITEHDKKLNNKRSCVYKITCTTNNKIYIGSTNNMYKRMISFAYGFRNYISKKCNKEMLQDCKMYGIESFVYEVLEDVTNDKSKRLDRESYWIQKLNSTQKGIGYNVTIDDSKTRHFTKRYRESLSVAGKQRYIDFPELKTKISNMLMGRIFSDESKSKLSASKHRYKIVQLDSNKNIIKVWDKVSDIIASDSKIQLQNIYSNCNGYKSGKHRGYYWRYLSINDNNPENYIRTKHD